MGTHERPLLTLLAGDALHTVPLDSVRSLQINDAALADELRQALAAVAQGRDAGQAARDADIHRPGEGLPHGPDRLPARSPRLADLLPPGPGRDAPPARLGAGPEHGPGRLERTPT